jgi:hypothetical protein
MPTGLLDGRAGARSCILYPRLMCASVPICRTSSQFTYYWSTYVAMVIWLVMHKSQRNRPMGRPFVCTKMVVCG